MDALLVIFIISIIVRAIGRKSTNKNKRSQAVEEQRARREAYQAAQRQTDNREHPWQSSGDIPKQFSQAPEKAQQTQPISAAQKPRPTQQTRPVQKASPIQQTRTVQQNKPVQMAQTVPVPQAQQQQTKAAAQQARKTTPPMEKTIPMETARMFGNGFSREELINGIIMSEILSPPRAKKPLHS